MTELTEHTPTPWGMWSDEGHTHTGKSRFSVCHNDLPVRDGWCEVGAEGEHKCVLETFGDGEAEAQANAAFIVKAVNAHQELVDTLRSALAILGHPDDAVSIAMREVLERLA